MKTTPRNEQGKLDLGLDPIEVKMITPKMFDIPELKRGSKMKTKAQVIEMTWSAINDLKELIGINPVTVKEQVRIVELRLLTTILGADTPPEMDRYLEMLFDL